MYTTVPRPEIVDHRPRSTEPPPQVIDHRHDRERGRWTERYRKEQLPYDTLKKQRDLLLEAEFKYKKTIKELEKEREELVVTYENTYQQNKQLKSILEHGPDAVKLKQLEKDRKDQKGLIERLEDENKQLALRLKELEKLAMKPHDDIIDKNWKETLDKVRKRREEEDAIPTQGPFGGGKLFKRKRIAIDDARMEELDTYDLQLDSIHKETQVLLNKVKQLKKEKEQIDFSLMMGKGAVTRNAVMANAISEKLNRDLNKYAIRLEKLKLKHKGAKQYVNEIRQLVQGDSANETKSLAQSLSTSKVTLEEGLVSPDTDSLKSKKLRTYKANGQVKLPNDQNPEQTKSDNVPHLPEIKAQPDNSPTSPRSPRSKAGHQNSTKDSDRANWIPPKNFDRPGTYSDIHQKSVQYSSEHVLGPLYPRERDLIETRHSLPEGQVLNNSFRDDMRIQREKHRIKTSSQGAQVKTTRAQSMRKSWMKKKLEPAVHGKGYYNEGFDNIRHQKRNNVNAILRSDNRPPNPKSAKTSKSFPLSPPNRLESKHQLDDSVSYDDVLAYLKRQSEGPVTDVDFKQAFREHKQRQRPQSPVPINFNTDGRNFHARGGDMLMGNTGIRRENFYTYL